MPPAIDLEAYGSAGQGLAPLPEGRTQGGEDSIEPSTPGGRSFGQMRGSSFANGSRRLIHILSGRGNSVANLPPRQPSNFAKLQPSPSVKRGLDERGAANKNFVSVTNINKYMQEATGVNKAPLSDSTNLEVRDPTTQTKPDPQAKTPLPGRSWIWLFVALNVIASIVYVWWRISAGTITNMKNSFFDFNYEDDFVPAAGGNGWELADDAPIYVKVYAWLFFGAEICLIIAMWIGHSQRLFAVQRAVVTMDDLVVVDDNVGFNSRVCIFLPTAGERLDIVLKALLGCMSQRGWAAGTTKHDYQRIIILDEKRRKGVLTLAAAAYTVATLLQRAEVRKLLQFEGVLAPNAINAYAWWKNGGGYARRHLYNDPLLNQLCAVIQLMEDVACRDDSGKDIFFLKIQPGVAEKANWDSDTTTIVEALKMAHVSIEPGYIHKFDSNVNVPTLIYYSRKQPGTPKVSPKAGNMNAAIFAIDYPDMPPLIGDSTIVAVNDCRHQLQPEFLQRTVPYFFELHEDTQTYCWARIAYVQTPQRFVNQKEVHDPLGNHATMQYDVINHGKDGIGAVGSSGHGSLWRVAALQGYDATGAQVADASKTELVGKKLGFRSEMLIEDTHTSIEMFRAGWRSVYINEPGEHLSVCTHQPDNIGWRIKQVLRWHQGAVQLLLFKGPLYTSFGAQFPTFFHRVYAFDQATYYMQAIPGYMLLLMPIIYGISGQSPFTADVFSFFVRFVPFIVTAILPTAILGSRRGVNADRLARDEQVWLSTTYVQMYAFITMLWQTVARRNSGDAWAVKAPTWPLFAAFWGEILAIAGAVCWLIYFNYQSARIQALPALAAQAAADSAADAASLAQEAAKTENYPTLDWSLNFYSIVVSALMALHALWPMVSLQMGFKVPSLYNQKIAGYLIVGGIIVLVSGVAYFQSMKYDITTDQVAQIGG